MLTQDDGSLPVNVDLLLAGAGAYPKGIVNFKQKPQKMRALEVLPLYVKRADVSSI
ncbi:MAG: hypothetical protein NT166_19820 [Candidatus Aminicenantes bacterium]|nr:hypothetical protein [Candidatus Aminicenantes bacterium]